MANFINETKNFEIINRDLIFDNELSDRARFVYCYMAAKPVDWDFFMEPMADELGYSVQTLRKYLRELARGGWIECEGQENNDGKSGANKYTLKAIKNKGGKKNYRVINFPIRKNSDAEKVSHKQNRDVLQNRDNNKEKEKKEYKENKEKAMFADFVSLYRKLTKKNVRSVDTEFRDFTTRHVDWREVLPYLPIAIERETKAREEAKAQHRFFPEPKMLQTYLGRQRAWELYVKVGEDIGAARSEYVPQQSDLLSWNERCKCFLYIGFDTRIIPDGYSDDSRPDGAEVMLNNGRGIIRWNGELRKWQRANDGKK